MNGTPCDVAGNSASCHLNGEQRQRLMLYLHGRLHAAQASYNAACLELKIEKLLEKPDDLPWWVVLMLDGLGQLIGLGLGKAVQALHAEGLKSLARELKIPDPGWRSSAAAALKYVNAKTMETQLQKRALDPAKKALQAQFTAEHNARRLDNLSARRSPSTSRSSGRHRRPCSSGSTSASTANGLRGARVTTASRGRARSGTG